MSPYLLAPLLAWLLAQLIKYSIHGFKHKSLKMIKVLYSSGSMPSAHTSTVVSLMVIVWATEGVGSPLFALSAVFALITAYDSMHVRRAAGEQGDALSELLSASGSKATPYRAAGHRPLEVLAGALLGAVVGLAVLSFGGVVTR